MRGVVLLKQDVRKWPGHPQLLQMTFAFRRCPVGLGRTKEGLQNIELQTVRRRIQLHSSPLTVRNHTLVHLGKNQLNKNDTWSFCYVLTCSYHLKIRMKDGSTSNFESNQHSSQKDLPTTKCEQRAVLYRASPTRSQPNQMSYSCPSNAST